MAPPAPRISAVHTPPSAWPGDEEEPVLRQEPLEERQFAQSGRQQNDAAQPRLRSREVAELPSKEEEQAWGQDQLDPSEEGEEQGGYLSEGWDTDDYDPTTWGEPHCAQGVCQ